MRNPFMPFWINDYRQDGDVRLMGFEARGFYLELIFECWAQDGLIPSDPASLARLLGKDCRNCRRLLGEVRHKFYLSNGKLGHKRVDEELAKAEDRSQKAKNAADKRWGKGDANASEKSMPSILKSKSQPIKENKEKKEVPTEATEIKEYWKANLNNEEMVAGLDNLLKLQKKKGISFEVLFQCAKNYHDYLKANGKIGTQFIYRMRNFFGRDERYKDYIEKAENGPSNQATGGIPGKDKDYGSETTKKL